MVDKYDDVKSYFQEGVVTAAGIAWGGELMLFGQKLSDLIDLTI